MKIENAKAQMRKGILEYCILSILENQDAYASDIINRLKEAELIVVEGTLYPLLTRLKNAGLLKYRWEESTQGPPRKYYALTDEGAGFLHELDHSWNNLIGAVEKIKNPEKQ
ncbi:lineage-specific thermal regulator protein [Salinivirga cyanobacteriivorans]|uniref:Lineage-specific thermal regulator protein n=1 Tax=Salinivirga cyanobacteriivorans TaxID=1307839 RepID=A0A0S2I0Q8_9BACT|nr:PadR family transcriptional regulator [Salinivirga cyanobacteriivorans]ALO15993.1 lineage-specific thermal regulator protein [Salinivirga cyanobacteriivorans]